MKKSLSSKQQGMASITVTLIIMVVISLIVLGFALTSRREQRQSLDQQLNTQAFYAAESGVNDVVKLIKDGVKQPGFNPALYDKQTCDNNGVYASLNKTLASNVQYTCVLVDPNPTEQTYSNVDDNPIVVPLRTQSNINISKLVLEWKPSTAPSSTHNLALCPSVASIGQFAPATSWQCDYGILRVDMVNTELATTKGNLLNAQLSMFAVPTAGAGNISYNARNQPEITAANCTTTLCKIEINGVNTPGMGLQLRSLYKPSDVTIYGVDNNTNKRLEFYGGQMIVDVTGKAQDILKRIQVTVPYNQNGIIPPAAVQSNTSICKRFTTAPGYFEINQAGIIDGNNLANNDSMCRGIVRGTANPGGAGVAGLSTSDPNAPSGGTGGTGGTGGGLPVPGRYWFTRTVWNATTLQGGVSIVGCTWSFGDGTQVLNRGCNPGDPMGHRFPDTVANDSTYPAACRNNAAGVASGHTRYDVVLEVYFSNGTVDRKTVNIGLPICIPA